MLVFPSIIPNYINNFKLPSYRSNTNQFADAQQTVLFNSLGVDAQITLKYSQIRQAEFNTLSDFYKRQGQTANQFTLPDAIWRHPDIVKLAFNPVGTYWVFANRLPFNVRYANKECSLFNLDIQLKQVLRGVVNPGDWITSSDFKIN